MDASERSTLRQLTAALEAALRGEPTGADLKPGTVLDPDLRALQEAVERIVRGGGASGLIPPPGHDPMTGLYDRTCLDEELARLDQSRLFPISVILAGLDDTDADVFDYRLLRDAAWVISRGVRGGDLVARLEDNEFAVILPETDLTYAAKVLERIREGELEYNSGRDAARLGLSLGMSTAAHRGSLRQAVKEAKRRLAEDREARLGH